MDGHFEDAYRLCCQALEGFEEGSPAEGHQLMDWMDLASAASYRLGLYAEADRWLALGMAMRLRTEQRLENGLERLAFTWLALGQLERAASHLHQAERLKKRYYDPDQGEMLVPTLEAQAGLALSGGRYPLAERFAKRAVARAKPGATMTRALTCLARVMWYQDRPREALAVCHELMAKEAPTRPCERWHWAHLAVSHALAGDLPAARQAARTLGALVDRKDRSLLLGWRWLTGQIAWLQSDLRVAIEEWQICRQLASELYSGAHFQRALVAYSLALAWWKNKQVDLAFEMAEEVIELCPLSWFGGRALRALGLELLALGCLEKQHIPRALELTAEALQCLSGEDNQWLAVGAGGVVHWHDALDDAEPGTWMPLCWPLGALANERELQARALATRAKALRLGNWETEATAAANLARAVRQSSGQGQLVERSSRALAIVKSACLSLKVAAPGRLPSWISVDDDHGVRAMVGLEGSTGTILVGHGTDRKLLESDHELFARPLGEGEQKLELYVTSRAGSKRVGMMPFLVTLGFQTGPPLRVPVRMQ